MRRWHLVVAAALVLLGAGLGLVTNYASTTLPAFFEADPLRVWFVYGLVVLAVLTLTLVGTRIGEAPAAAAATPAYGTGADSSRAPTLGVAVRGRDRELRRLTGRHARGLVVLAGAGGMGKTTLATAVADAARRHGQRVHWVRFRDGEQLTGRMLEVAEQLGPPRAKIAAAQQAGASLPDLVWDHLDRTRGWMIVLDNADRPAATCPSGDPLAEYRGWVRPARRGLLVVTSRDRASWGPRAMVVPIGPLSPDDGARVLRDLAPSGGDGARRLAARLGGLPLALGEHHQAADLHRANLTARERVLDPDHPDTLNSRNNLAVTLGDLSEHRQAADLHRTTLSARERVLGPDHPDTLNSRNNLAVTLGDLSEHRQAADLHRAALTAQERVLGPDHPDTLRSRNNPRCRP